MVRITLKRAHDKNDEIEKVVEEAVKPAVEAAVEEVKDKPAEVVEEVAKAAAEEAKEEVVEEMKEDDKPADSEACDKAEEDEAMPAVDAQEGECKEGEACEGEEAEMEDETKDEIVSAVTELKEAATEILESIEAGMLDANSIIRYNKAVDGACRINIED